MSDIWSAVQWQLRILVLSSLGFQWFLVLVIPMRNYTIQRWLRACIWLACICADVLAIYALATLLYRQAAGRWWFSSFDVAQQWRSSLPLEALWAPLLLVHLAGREEFAANNMDGTTSLWVRHAAVLVTLTVYAFSTSRRYFSDDRDGFRLLASAALLLIAAVVSSCGKPWVLRRASVRQLVAKSSLAKGAMTKTIKTTTKTKTKTNQPCCSGWWEWCFTELGDRYKCWKELKPRSTAPMLSQGDKVQMLLSGMSLHAARATLETRTKADQKILEPLKPWRREQYEAPEDQKVDVVMNPWLRQAFGLIYTRETALFTPAYLACHALLVPSLYLAAVMLLFTAVSYKKHGYSRYSRADVDTTYALLCFTAALDVLGMFVGEAMYSLLSSSFGAKKLLGTATCENLPGHNLMDSVLWKIRRPIVSMMLLRCYKGGHSVTDEDGLYASVLELITNELKLEDKGEDKDFDLDFSSYRSLSKRNWILKDEKLREVCRTKPNIRDSLRKKAFDESVLVWHIATDLCFRAKPPRRFRFRPPPKEVEREVCTEVVSNYMAYLLDRRPEMLMAGSRQHLFAEAMAKMELVVRAATEGLRPKLREKQPLDDVIRGKIKVAAAILAKDKDAYSGKIKQEEAAASLKDNKEPYTVIHDACKLAEELLGMEDDDDRWNLMHRVWVGMLCYSASMCRADLHAKSLAKGGEFLSNVWLLVSLIGARTLADKLQMPDDEDPEPERNVLQAPAMDNKGEPKQAGEKVQTPD